jgi:hypothetical protein
LVAGVVIGIELTIHLLSKVAKHVESIAVLGEFSMKIIIESTRGIIF